MLILIIVQLDITLDFFFLFFSSYFVYTSACNLVFVFVLLITVKVMVSVCEDGVKLNYFSIRFTETEPYVFVEAKGKVGPRIESYA